MKKCTSCGLSNDDDARFCAGCGAALADAPVVDEQAAPVQADDPFAEPVAAPAEGVEQFQDQQPQETKQKKGLKATAVSIKDKTVGFEKKHSIILNAIVIACALVVIFVALFAPIKVVNYRLVPPEQYSKIYESYSEKENSDGDTEEQVTYHYVEVSQSIWQIIGATSYLGADLETVAELEEELEAAQEAAMEEYAEWELSNFDLDDLEDMDEDKAQDLMIEAQNKMVEIYADHLSDVNVLGYVFAQAYTALDAINDQLDNITGDGSDSDRPTGDYDPEMLALSNVLNASFSIGFAMVIVILSIVAAIISLVYLIKAIIGMVKKQPQNKLFKYFGTMLGLSCAALILSMVTPLLAPGGGMLAIAVFMSVMYFVCGSFGSFVFGKDGLLLSIKRSAIALLSMVAFFLLCTNVFAATSGSTGSTETLNAPMGYGFGGFYSTFIPSISVNNPTESFAYELVGNCVNAIGGFVTFLFMIFTVSLLLSAYKRSLRRLAFGTVAHKSSMTGMAIAGAVFAVISIVVSMIIPSAITELIGDAFRNADLELDLSELVTGFAVRAQVWVSFILFLVCAIFNIVFNPKSKNPEANAAQQA